MSTQDDVRDYYHQYDEAGRLQQGVSHLEFVRTQEVMLRHLPPAPAVIYDIGGAAGAYSFWLAELGHQVHLLDLTPKHIEQARVRNAGSTHPLASLQVGDGRALPFADATADVVLVMGPLYHLPERADRLQSLLEARRVLKPGGLLVAAAISRYASLLDGFLSDYVRDPAFVEIMRQDLACGRHRGDGEKYFTTAFLHHPEELAAEVCESGFPDACVYAMEGFGGIIPDFETKWQDPAFRTLLLDLLRQLETEPTMLGMSFHLLAVGRKGL